jgi:non-ribosomal peptide synthetase component E (peptide arylation enzyme)
METITAAVARQARDRPRSIALVDGATRLAWAEVKTWMDRAAGWLLALGLPRGATVLGWMPNCAEWYLARLACEQAGLFWIPVPASQGPRELASIIERVRPAVLITKPRFRDRDYVIVGRLKDLIIRGGDKVSPAEIEALLRTHSGMAQVAVVGAPDPVLGETVCACIVPRTKDRPPELEALRRHLRELGLAPYKGPERMLVLDSLPVVGDKIDRRALVAMVTEPATT